MVNTHGVYSPSQLTRIINCPGSVGATIGVARTSSVYAEEGTMLHSVVEACLDMNEQTVSKDTITQFNLTVEQTEAVQEVLDWVSLLKMQYAECADSYEIIEQRVSLTPYIAKTKCEHLAGCSGTLDYSLAIPEKNTLYIADWKFGKGVEVYPDIAQLKAYALGRLASLDDWKEYTKIIMVIVQPRLYSGDHIKTHEMTVSELFSWLTDVLIPALSKTQLRYPPFNPTEEGCMWCAIKNTCTHRRSLAVKTASKVFEVFAKIPNEITEDELSNFLKDLPLLEKYISDIQKYAYSLLSNGKPIKGFKLVAGRSVRKWGDEARAKKHLLELEYDVDDLQVSKFKTPPQIEKTIGKKNMDEVLQECIIKPPGNPTMVPASDKRAPLKVQTASEAFDDYKCAGTLE